MHVQSPERRKLFLNRMQEKIFDGEQGTASALAMNLIVKLGKAYDAKRLVPIASAHVLAHFSSLHLAGTEMLEKFVSLDGRYVVPTTVDPASVDLDRWRELGWSADYAKKQFRLCRAYAKLGGIPNWSCVPYQFCNFPRCGESLAWSESSAVCFANSIIGAKTNRMAAGLDTACALVGLTPEFGLLLPENRIGTFAIELQKKNPTPLDLQTLGLIIGKTVGIKIPVVSGVPPSTNVDDLKRLGAAAATSGSTAMMHLLGITPEGRTKEEAFGDQRPEDKMTVGDTELARMEEQLDTSNARPDMVAIGGPHCSLNELVQIGQLLTGKQLKRDVSFWIFTAKHFANLAENMGLKRLIEKTGAKILSSTCGEIIPIDRLGFSEIATNSAKFAHSIPSEHKVGIRYCALEECVRLACG